MQIQNIKSVELGETPLYEGVDYDSLPATYFDYVVIATLEDGRVFTHSRAFNGTNERRYAENLVNVVRKRGKIDLYHWWEGTTWDRYKIPQTYEEEKAQALEFENDNPTIGW